MKTRLVKLAAALCLLCLAAPTGSLQAQDTNADVPPPPGYAYGTVPQPPGYGGRSGPVNELPEFDIQIEDGKLSLAPLKGRADATNFWALLPSSVQAKIEISSVRATMENLSKFLRVVDPRLNIVLAPGTEGLVISNLKLKTSNLNTVSEAIAVATSGTIRGSGAGRSPGADFGGGAFGRAAERTITFTSRAPFNESTVEVFNLSGYIQTLGNPDQDTINQKLSELKGLIVGTLGDLHHGWSSADGPNFQYHSGTRLLIVTGKPEAIDLTRKIVNALSGQQSNSRLDLRLDATPPPAQK